MNRRLLTARAKETVWDKAKAAWATAREMAQDTAKVMEKDSTGAATPLDGKLTMFQMFKEADQKTASFLFTNLLFLPAETYDIISAKGADIIKFKMPCPVCASRNGQSAYYINAPTALMI